MTSQPEQVKEPPQKQLSIAIRKWRPTDAQCKKATASSMKGVLQAMASYDWRLDGSFKASLKTLEGDTGLSERTIRNAMSDLKRLGIVSQHNRDGFAGAGGKYVYAIHKAAMQPALNAGSSPDQPATTAGSYGGQPANAAGSSEATGKYCSTNRQMLPVQPANAAGIIKKENKKHQQGAGSGDDFCSASKDDREPWTIDDGLIRTACKAWRKANGASSQSESTREAFRLCVSNGAAHHGVTAPLDDSNALGGQQAAVRQIVWYAETLSDREPNFWPKFNDTIVGDALWSNDLQQRAYAVMIERQSDAKMKSCLKAATRSGRLIIRDGSEMDRLAAMIRSVQPDERMNLARYIEAEGFETLAGLADGVKVGV